ncbi:hypothetical protein YenMTG1_068 [Yersinia phage vB_YenM_TG1]|uniref:Uncharacterized protein n=1 Tax=Yersinia phage vB_YenM_TG1 TaxID=1589265 RepID=A0A0B4ZZA4_9CAUD|nr:hypothetical protein AVV33_gp068 [Yersinia phage vB_YenM_TG1]AJD81878.1 hypothetical protein YenMTG1_068 [Yersinia phage vB_YenM_TG1]
MKKIGVYIKEFTIRASLYDWPDDQSYFCKCHECDIQYRGPKRSYYCYVCSKSESVQFAQIRAQKQQMINEFIKAKAIVEANGYVLTKQMEP